jgi:hypothetical protein
MHEGLTIAATEKEVQTACSRQHLGHATPGNARVPPALLVDGHSRPRQVAETPSAPQVPAGITML